MNTTDFQVTTQPNKKYQLKLFPRKPPLSSARSIHLHFPEVDRALPPVPVITGVSTSLIHLGYLDVHACRLWRCHCGQVSRHAGGQCCHLSQSSQVLDKRKPTEQISEYSLGHCFHNHQGFLLRLWSTKLSSWELRRGCCRANPSLKGK